MIRLANKFDFDDICKLILQFAIKEKSYKDYPIETWSKTYVIDRLNEILSGLGFILIDDKKTAVLIALKTQSIWVQNEIHLIEVMLHANNKITAVKLIKEYKKIALNMKAEGKISKAIISNKINTNFNKLGFEPIEMQWGI